MKLYKIIFVMKLGYFVNIPDVPGDNPPPQPLTQKNFKDGRRFSIIYVIYY